MTHDHYHGHHGDDDDCEYFRAKIVEWSSRVFIGYRKSMARRKHSYYLNIKFFLEMIKRAVIVNDRTQSISHIRFCPHLSRQNSLNAVSSFYNLKAEDSLHLSCIHHSSKCKKVFPENATIYIYTIVHDYSS